ncbi:MAG: hypothetical protein ACOYNG_09815, partial [Terrimicrobiaceae bacterium]
MGKSFQTALAGILAALLLSSPVRAEKSHPADQGQVALAVADLLQKHHYSRARLDDAMSQRLLDTYLELLDYNKLYLNEEDVSEFREKYATSLDDMILRGDLSPAHEIFDRFKSRVEARVESNKKLVKETTDFTCNGTVELNRQKSPWPANTAEADQIWADRVKAELLQEKLSEFKLRTPEETVTRRYGQALRNVREMEGEDVVKTFLSALAQSYDPHSEYLSPSDMEN